MAMRIRCCEALSATSGRASIWKLFRCTILRYFRILIVICICYLLLHLLILPSPDPDVSLLDNHHHHPRHAAYAGISTTSSSSSITTSPSPPPVISTPQPQPHHNHNKDRNNRVEVGQISHEVSDIRQWMLDQNEAQVVHNADTYQHAPLLSNHTVIVVQVHNRTEYLRHLIESLERCRGIQNVLLIFSHDFYSPDINTIINSITFCRVLQIFYPHNMQVYPNKFPGADNRDCPRDIKRPEAIKSGCINAHHPDKFGHYREAKYCQTKHHWFWKLSFVFESLRVITNHTGLFLFIEEDHYITEDGLTVLHMMQALRMRSHAECNILCLGDYSKKLPKSVDSDKVDIMMWLSNKHNMGMAFDIHTYRNIKRCATAFCQYDDYNWDWSLMFISQKCMLPKLVVMASKVARVLHIGECGLHKKSKECQPRTVISRIENSFKKSFNMFPTSLSVGVKKLNAVKMPKVNGGWGDTRDHVLCQNYTHDTLVRLQR